LDDYAPLRDLKPELLEDNHFFPIKPGQMFAKGDPLGVSGRGFQGANYYVAPNPDYGATFTFYLKEELKTKKGERQRKDRQLQGAGKDAPYPSWEDLKAEDREVAPSRWLTIRDSAGNVVRKLPTTTGKGLVRTTWDMRHAGTGGGGRRRGGGGPGPLAIPGTYTVEISQMVDGEVTPVLAATSFEIQPLNFGSTSEPDRQAILEFSRQVGKLSNAVSAATQLASEASERLAAVEALVFSAAEVDPELWKEIRALQVQLLDIQEKFSGDPTRTRRNEDGMPGLQSRLGNALMGALGSTSGPTGTHRRQFEIAGAEFEAVSGELRKLLDTEIPALLQKFDGLGAPWTPGRPIPDWK
jgi:hypothetical protein